MIGAMVSGLSWVGLWVGLWLAPSDMLVSPGPNCMPSSVRAWRLNGEVQVVRVLEEVSHLTCERFVVPAAIAKLQVTLNVHGEGAATVRELRNRVIFALRDAGIVVDHLDTGVVRKASKRAAIPTS